MTPSPSVIFDEVSKFYGEVLGVNRVTLNIPPGITSLVGPNGSGKTTLMNLMTGLIHPDNGQILMRGISPRDPEALMRITGYATQYDTAPRWATGFTFITTGLLLFGYGRAEAEEKAWKALERLSLTEAANRKVAGYSKGMAGAEKVGAHKTSMLQDAEAGRPLEIAPLIGAFVELGQLTETPMPATEAVFALVTLLDARLRKEAPCARPPERSCASASGWSCPDRCTRCRSSAHCRRTPRRWRPT